MSDQRPGPVVTQQTTGHSCRYPTAVAASRRPNALPPPPDAAIGPSRHTDHPLDNAVGYGCWHVARRLVERGARVNRRWHAAALGLMSRVEELAAAGPTPEQMGEAFWQACDGGQRRAAEYLLRHGADITAIPSYAQQTALDVAAGPDVRREILVAWLREHGARPSEADQ